MKYILDTDILIYFLKGQKNVVDRVSNLPSQQRAVTIINSTELLFGAFNSQKKKENLQHFEAFLKNFEILPFCHSASLIFAEQKAVLKKEGKMIDDLDLMIASITLQHKATLLTNNLRHFERIQKLKAEAI